MSAKRLFFGALICIVVTASVTVTLVAPDHWGWFLRRIAEDFWPIDKSRVAPNILASTVQWIVVGLIATFLYRPIKRWINAELDHVNAKIDHAIQENPNTTPLPDHLKGRPNERK